MKRKLPSWIWETDDYPAVVMRIARLLDLESAAYREVGRSDAAVVLRRIALQLRQVADGRTYGDVFEFTQGADDAKD